MQLHLPAPSDPKLLPKNYQRKQHQQHVDQQHVEQQHDDQQFHGSQFDDKQFQKYELKVEVEIISLASKLFNVHKICVIIVLSKEKRFH